MMQRDDRVWEDFSFVVSSGYRARVIRCLGSKPQMPSELSKETNLSLAHVSRALRQLSDRGLVECLTPRARTRGRLYHPTELGTALVRYLDSSNRRFPPPPGFEDQAEFIPRVRASMALRCIRELLEAHGEAAVRRALEPWSVDFEEVTENTWLSVDALNGFLELIEGTFGDGSHDLIRRLYRRSISSISSVREELLKLIPIHALAERVPIVYHKEVNYGRLEVKADRRGASFRHYDWMPSPAMCAMFQGVYEGILQARQMEGEVTKTRCVRTGDGYCEYVVSWRAAPKSG